MANVRAPNLTFSTGTRPNAIPVNAPVPALAGPIVLPPRVDSTQGRAPNLNFATGVQPNRIPVSVAISQTSGPIIIEPSDTPCKPAPRLLLYGAGGGGGATEHSYPISG